MCDKEKIHELIENIEAKGQKVIDEANLLDSYIVTYVIIREGWGWTKKIWGWVKAFIARRGVKP